MRARALLFAAVLVATVGCDHATKQIAQASLGRLGVTDFVSLGVNGLRTGIFNVADVAILAGVALALLQPGSQRPLGSGS